MDDPEQSRMDLSELPAEVVDLLVLRVSQWLTQADKTDVPTELVPVAGFRPGHRHRDPRARAALTRCLTRNPVLVERVSEWLDGEKGPDPAGQGPNADEMAAAWLRGDKDKLTELLKRSPIPDDLPVGESELVSRLEKRIYGLQEELDSTQRRHAANASSKRDKLARQSVELADTRSTLGQVTGKVHDLEGQLVSLQEKLTDEVTRASDRYSRNRARIRELESEVAQAHRERSQDRRSSRYLERLEVARIQVLLSAAQSAIAGLTREIASGAAASPADLLRSSESPSNPLPRKPGPNQLANWLVVPGLHLLVDGYNVTKAATPDLPLAQQRELLVGRLCSLAARTGAEVTVVFDAQNVSLTMPSSSRKGVRVIFTDEGEIADDVIVDLVSVEPPGRAVMVITSDQELSSRVARLGARAVPSQDFNEVMDRG